MVRVFGYGVSVALLALALPLAGRAQCTRYAYTIQDLGAFGGSNSQGLAINSAGQVTGFAEDANGVDHAFRSDANGIITRVDTSTIPTYGETINDPGKVGGYVDFGTGDIGFLSDGTTVSTLQDSVGGVQLYIFAVNTPGQMAGFQRDPSGNGRAFKTDTHFNITDLGVPGGYVQSTADGINAAGQLSGYATDINGNGGVAFRVETNNVMKLLGTLGGSESYGYGINASGQVVGESLTSTNTYFHAFLSNAAGTTLKDLGTITGYDTAGYSVNTAGDVVGFVYSEDEEFPEGAVASFAGAAFVDLGTLIDPATGWTLVAAYGINDHGQITGWGIRNGVTRAFRMTPNGAPFPYGDANGDGSINVQDVVSILKSALGGQAVPNFLAADVAPAGACNGRGFGDGRVTVADAVRVARFLAGLEKSLT